MASARVQHSIRTGRNPLLAPPKSSPFLVLFFILILTVVPVHAGQRNLSDSDFWYQQCVGSPCQQSAWVLNSYTTCSSGTSQSVTWTPDLVSGDAGTTNGCGLVGWHTDYAAGGNMCWGCLPSSTYQYGVSLNPLFSADPSVRWSELAVHTLVTVTSDTSIGQCSFFSSQICQDVYLDFWIYWTSPVGPSNFQAMEFMLQLESSRCNSITGCPSDFFGLGPSDYEYFHRITWVELNAQDYFLFNGNDMYNLLNTAFGHWNLPSSNAYIVGLDVGQEIGGGNYAASATFDEASVFNCPNTVGGVIGYSITCTTP